MWNIPWNKMFWKNNGPRPPYDDEEILEILMVALRFFLLVYLPLVLLANGIGVALIDALQRLHIL